MSDKELRAKVEALLRSQRTDGFYDDYPECFQEFVCWMMKQVKKAPYYLFQQTGVLSTVASYDLIYRDGPKVKFARFTDGMRGRYGPQVLGTLSSPGPQGLWQKRAGALPAGAYEAMLAVYNGEATLPEFDFLYIYVEGM